MNALDLIVVAPELVAFPDILERLNEIGGHAEIVVDRRHDERRHSAATASRERRRSERRQRDVDEELQREGCVVIPAEGRHP